MTTMERIMKTFSPDESPHTIFAEGCRIVGEFFHLVPTDAHTGGVYVLATGKRVHRTSDFDFPYLGPEGYHLDHAHAYREVYGRVPVLIIEHQYNWKGEKRERAEVFAGQHGLTCLPRPICSWWHHWCTVIAWCSYCRMPELDRRLKQFCARPAEQRELTKRLEHVFAWKNSRGQYDLPPEEYAIHVLGVPYVEGEVEQVLALLCDKVTHPARDPADASPCTRGCIAGDPAGCAELGCAWWRERERANDGGTPR